MPAVPSEFASLSPSAWALCYEAAAYVHPSWLLEWQWIEGAPRHAYQQRFVSDYLLRQVPALEHSFLNNNPWVIGLFEDMQANHLPPSLLLVLYTQYHADQWVTLEKLHTHPSNLSEAFLRRRAFPALSRASGQQHPQELDQTLNLQDFCGLGLIAMALRTHAPGLWQRLRWIFDKPLVSQAEEWILKTGHSQQLDAKALIGDVLRLANLCHALRQDNRTGLTASSDF